MGGVGGWVFPLKNENVFNQFVLQNISICHDIQECHMEHSAGTSLGTDTYGASHVWTLDQNTRLSGWYHRASFVLQLTATLAPHPLPRLTPKPAVFISSYCFTDANAVISDFYLTETFFASLKEKQTPGCNTLLRCDTKEPVDWSPWAGSLCHTCKSPSWVKV